MSAKRRREPSTPLRVVDSWNAVMMIRLVMTRMEIEGIEQSVVGGISEGIRAACFLHMHAPEFLRLIARWYADDGTGRSDEELARACREWVDAITTGADELRAVAERGGA